jgi:glycosyltransferase involved in cell wall biosynthesis
VKSAHLQPGGPTPPFENLLAALSHAHEETLALTQSGPEWLVRLRTRRALARFAPPVLVAWSPQAVRVASTGPWRLLGRPAAGADPAQYAACDHLLAVSQAEGRRIVREGWPRPQVHTLPDVVPDLAGAAPATHAAPPGVPVILSLAPLQKTAGIDILLAALTRLPDAHALIAGEGPERTALKKLARDACVSGRVHFLGNQTDAAALLAACDVVVSPARHDSLGEPILQAFSAGKPVVATMSEAALDLLRSGTAGILVPMDSGIALAAGIEGMLANAPLAAAMAAAGRRNFESTYAEAAVAASWREALAKLSKG